jgi:hypothetical protein
VGESLEVWVFEVSFPDIYSRLRYSSLINGTQAAISPSDENFSYRDLRIDLSPMCLEPDPGRIL